MEQSSSSLCSSLLLVEYLLSLPSSHLSSPSSRACYCSTVVKCSNMHYVYILKDSFNSLYIGYSSNLKQRLVSHLNGESVTTSKMTNLKLIHYESYETEKLARNREFKAKTIWFKLYRTFEETWVKISQIGLSFNGRTVVSKTANSGSSPDSPAICTIQW